MEYHTGHATVHIFLSTYLIQAQDRLSAWFDLHVSLSHEIVTFLRSGTISSFSLSITIFWSKERIILAKDKRLHLDSHISSLKKPGYQHIYKNGRWCPLHKLTNMKLAPQSQCTAFVKFHSDVKVNFMNILSNSNDSLLSCFCSSGCVLLPV